VQEKVAPGTGGVEPDAVDIRLVQRHLHSVAYLLAPPHRFILRQRRIRLHPIYGENPLPASACDAYYNEYANRYDYRLE
jgi:hypothetical protein